ncbi:MAG: hypothetical protein JWM36_36 [Hyphomicrobiales bacterium]|nr:hypothetical protein [Hyphomicrobiales bacterium]
MTRMVGLMGAALPKDPLPPSSDNEEGFWESATLVGIHDQLLEAVDSVWFDPLPLSLRSIPPDLLSDWKERISSALVQVYGQADCFVVKDPRLCRLVPLYREILTSMDIDVRVVLVSRPPSEVAASLLSRDQISANLAGVLWARHMRDAERETRNLPRVMVTYSELMRDWRPAAARLCLACPGLSAADESGIDAAFRPDLRHHRRGVPPGSDADLFAHLDRLEKALGLLRQRNGAQEWREIDAIGSQIDGWTSTHADALADEYFCRRKLPAPMDWGRDELLAS